MSFAVVKFINDGDDDQELVSEVPTSWLNKDQNTCKWPPEKFVGIYINKSYAPEHDWSEHPVVIECFCDTLKEAKQKAKGEFGLEDKVGRGFRKSKKTEYFSPAEEEDRHIKLQKKINSGTTSITNEDDSHKDFMSLLNDKSPTVDETIDERVVEEEKQTTLTNEESSNSQIDQEYYVPVSSPSDPSLSGRDTPVGQASTVTSVSVASGQGSTLISGSIISDNDINSICNKLDKVLTLMGRFSIELQALREQMNELQNPSIKIVSATFPIKFPLNNLSHLEQLEEYCIKEDGKINFINHIKAVGGNDAKDLSVRILKNLFSNSLAEVCSWTGRKGNYEVGNLNCMKIIYYEYTRITTPRQDVLFKKGYLNKPKSYQAQTSTGTSTVSTGNSTENGTPDHQSTDLDYESQFMFPSGFVDQSTGIYYVNSYEPYPLMLFNPPTYYHECSNTKAKRTSTGSLSESMSPNTEEANSQDLSPASGGDVSNSMSDHSNGHPVYNMVFPGYYVNGACTPTDLTNSHQFSPEPVKKLKKRRERRISKNIHGDSSEYTDENSCDENREINPHDRVSPVASEMNEYSSGPAVRLDVHSSESSQKVQQTDVNDSREESKTECTNSNLSDNTLLNGCADTKTESNDEKPNNDQAQPNSDSPKSSVLKPDAEEFIPRSYLNLGHPQHIKMLPPNFMPIPLVPINDFGGQNFAPHPAFIPPGIPINFIPHHPGQKIFPPAPGFVNYAPPMIHEAKIEENVDQNEELPNDEKEKESTATPAHTPIVEESKNIVHSKVIDIATVVSKLEAVKQQENDEHKVQEESVPAVVNESNPFLGSPRFKRPPSFKRNYYNKYRSSPSRSGDSTPQIHNDDDKIRPHDKSHPGRSSSFEKDTVTQEKELKGQSPTKKSSPVRHVEAQLVQNGTNETFENRCSPARSVQELSPVQNCYTEPANYNNSPVRRNELPKSNSYVAAKPVDSCISYSNKSTISNIPPTQETQQVRNSPERIKKSWKPNGYQSGHQNGYASPRRVYNHQKIQNYQKPLVNGHEKPHINGDSSLSSIKNYSEPLKKSQISSPTSLTYTQTHITSDKTIKTVQNVSNIAPKSEVVKPKSNQWIPVSSRKKKKNKNMEEIDFNDEDVMLNESGQKENVSSDFELYDVTQLVDVIPTSQNEPSQEQEKKIEDILIIIAKNEPSDLLFNGQQTSTDIKIPEVSDIEKGIIEKIEEQKITFNADTSKEADVTSPQNDKMKEEVNEPKEVEQEIEVVQIHEEENFKPKKKSKKGTQKPLTKKVIITDIDLSMTVTELKTPIKKIVTKIEEVPPVEPQLVPIAQETVASKETTPEQSEKKSKKKKKNKSKSIQNGSLSESNANTSVDSYDNLLEKQLLSESTEKTNDDISLELEKLIQKGMYGSLQEKIKLINVEPEKDGFFKTFQGVSTPGKEKSIPANGFMQSTDFNKIFQSTRQFLKPNMVSVEHDYTDIKVAVDDIDNKDSKSSSDIDNKAIKSSSSAPDAAHTSPGLFLDNTEEVQEVQEATTDVTVEPISPMEKLEDPKEPKKLYPITQAVKEWMSKTREATPEVEILKSPTTIQREFGDYDSVNDILDSDEEDEITLFSTDDTASQDPDFLEYWENEVSKPETSVNDCVDSNCGSFSDSKVCSDGKGCAKCQINSIKEDEEEIQVYESKYGQNEAFLKLHKDLKEKQQTASRPDSLPNRTVCCSLQ